MTLKGFNKSSISKEGRIININKMIHENLKENPMKLLEKAKELSDDLSINLKIRVYTKINLSFFYTKEGFEFQALTILSQELDHLEEMNEFI